MLRRIRGEEGSALAGVVGLMLVIAVVSLAVLTSATTGAAYSTSARANVQSLAAADGGVDAVYANLSVGNYVCSLGATTAPAFTATVTYFNAAGNQMPCGSVVLGTPVSAEIRSTGTAANPGTGSTDGDERTVVATVALGSSAGSLALDKAIFSEGSFTLSNNVTIEESATGETDADLYSNGTIYCKTQLDIQGDITAQGDLSFENTCEGLGTIWVGGNASFSSSVNVKGSIFTAGRGTMTLANSSHIEGSLVTNGSVVLENSPGAKACPGTTSQWGVCGSVVALGGSISSKNGASIGGSAYSQSGFTATTANSTQVVGHDVVVVNGGVAGSNLSGTTVGGSIRAWGAIGIDKARVGNLAGSCQRTAGNGFASCGTAPAVPAPNPAVSLPAELGYPSSTGALPVVNAPVREELPRIESSATALAKWSGWTVRTFSGADSCAQAKSFLSGAWSGKQLLLVTGCSGPISWNNETLSVKGDLAILSTTGFLAGNNFKVASSSTTTHDLMWIVPSDGPGVSWSAVANTTPIQYSPSCTAAGGNIAITNQTTITGARWFLYSPCTVTINNQLNGFKGQIYGGFVTYPNNSAITKANIAVPGATSSSSSAPSFSAQITSRLDVTGEG
ncbi:hypothetical protein [Naasia sp. SYSU D00057]|uniref:hypothetical protein n=1 Tax=Naasia sp. SYSU D00057 TaxID=2817380 RepID=UPI001B3074CF|nr:hypothetical protein [Naasia sp. SYSU D00057]